MRSAFVPAVSTAVVVGLLLSVTGAAKAQEEPQEPPSQYEHVKVLEPFLGVWEGEFQPPDGPQGSLVLIARWTSNRSYLQSQILFRPDQQGAQPVHMGTTIVGRHSGDENLHIWGFWPDQQTEDEVTMEDTTLVYQETGVTVDGEKTSAKVRWGVSGDSMTVNVTDTSRGDAKLPDMNITLTRREGPQDRD